MRDCVAMYFRLLRYLHDLALRQLCEFDALLRLLIEGSFLNAIIIKAVDILLDIVILSIMHIDLF